MKRLVLYLFLISTSSIIFAQNNDSINLKDICIEEFCFGVKIKEVVQYFGKPDTIITRQMGDWEFEEPTHNVYYYNQLKIYEILSNEGSKGLLYGFNITRKNVSITIKGNSLVIGKTCIPEVENYFPNSTRYKKNLNEKEIMITINTILPNELKEHRGAFISAIYLIFTDSVLSEVWTPLDKN